MGRAIVSFLFSLLLIGLLVGVGAGIYQAGMAQGIVDAGRFPAGAAVPVGGYGWGFGFHGFLGLLFPILFFLLIFGLLRAAFGRGRGWGRGYGHGYGWGPGWKGYGPMEGGPDAWRNERERRIAELHKRLHEEEGAGNSGANGDSGGSGTPGQSPR